MQDQRAYPRVSVILLVYRKWEWAIKCLESLFQMRYPNFNVIVVDNCSGDNTSEKIMEWASGKIPADSKFFAFNPANKPIPCKLYQMDEAGRVVEDKAAAMQDLVIIQNHSRSISLYSVIRNRIIGFSMRRFNPDYILNIDNDNIVPADLLERLVGAAEKEPLAGIIGPDVRAYENPEEIVAEGRAFNPWTGSMPSWNRKWRREGQDYVEVDKVSTTCALVRCKTIHNGKLFEEGRFYGQNEQDLCLGLKRSGFKVLYLPELVMWNIVKDPPGYSQTRAEVYDWRAYIMPTGELYLCQKYCSRIQFASALLCLSARYFHSFVLFLIHTRRWTRIKYFAMGMYDYFWRYRKERGNHREVA